MLLTKQASWLAVGRSEARAHWSLLCYCVKLADVIEAKALALSNFSFFASILLFIYLPNPPKVQTWSITLIHPISNIAKSLTCLWYSKPVKMGKNDEFKEGEYDGKALWPHPSRASFFDRAHVSHIIRALHRTADQAATVYVSVAPCNASDSWLCALVWSYLPTLFCSARARDRQSHQQRGQEMDRILYCSYWTPRTSMRQRVLLLPLLLRGLATSTTSRVACSCRLLSFSDLKLGMMMMIWYSASITAEQLADTAYRWRQEGCKLVQDQMRSMPLCRGVWRQQDRPQPTRPFRSKVWSGRGLFLHRCQQAEGRWVEGGHPGEQTMSHLKRNMTDIRFSLSTSRTQRSTSQVRRWLSVDWRRARTGTTWLRMHTTQFI